MGRYGFGHGGKGGARLIAPLAGVGVSALEIAAVLPSPTWTGTAGTGFVSIPADPVRTTAKPIVRMIDPPNQYFTDELTFSVMAFANDGGTIIGGIDRVRFHFEGGSVDVVQPALRNFTRYDGSTYSLPCYTVRLKKPAGRAGVANLYIEAIPADATMQRRVLGPLQFSPAATKHDWDRTIGLTGSGADYTAATLATATLNALNAARTAAAQNPRVTYISSGTSDLLVGSSAYTAQGYMTVECATGVNVTFAKPSYTTDAAMLMRPRWDGMWFRGAGITFDMAYVSEVYHEAQQSVPTLLNGRSHVFEGVRFTRSTPRGALIRGNVTGGSVTHQVRGSPWFLECDLHNIQYAGQFFAYNRGCALRDTFNDAFHGAALVVGNKVTHHNSMAYRNPLPAMTVTYSGTGATADLSLSGGNVANGRVFTARVNGVSVGTFTVFNTEAAYTAGTNYTVANVVNWINSLGGGWAATLQDDTRYAAALSLGDRFTSFGAFTNQNVKGVTLQLFTAFDQHSDYYQKSDNVQENVLIYGNTGLDCDTQHFAVGGNATRDWAYINNAINRPDPSPEFLGNAQSQMSLSHSHVIIAHNTFPYQRMLLVSTAGPYEQYVGDAYCLIANNALQDLAWAGPVIPGVVIRDNHLHAAAVGTGSPGEVKAGNQITLYANAAAGDYTPAGALATNLKAPVWKLDLKGKLRGSSASVGAIA